MRLAVSAQDLISSVQTPQLNAKLPRFSPGDTVRFTVRVLEGEKERQQLFEGIVISRRGAGLNEMVTVRKLSFGVGVERIFPVHSPFVQKVEVVSHGKVRRAKLYYLRDKSGKESKLKRVYATDAEGATVVTAPPVEPGADAGDAAAAPAAPKAEAKPKPDARPKPAKAAVKSKETAKA